MRKDQHRAISKPQNIIWSPTAWFPNLSSANKNEWDHETMRVWEQSGTQSKLSQRYRWPSWTRGKSDPGERHWSSGVFVPLVIRVHPSTQRPSVHLENPQLLNEEAIKRFKVINPSDSLRSVYEDGDRGGRTETPNASLFQKTMNSADCSSLRHREVRTEINVSDKNP